MMNGKEVNEEGKGREDDRRWKQKERKRLGRIREEGGEGNEKEETDGEEEEGKGREDDKR